MEYINVCGSKYDGKKMILDLIRKGSGYNNETITYFH